MVQATAAAVAVAITVIAMPAHAVSEAQIRSDCRFDALQNCPTQAARCAVAETPSCRRAMIKCMSANKNNLSGQCRKHIR